MQIAVYVVPIAAMAVLLLLAVQLVRGRAGRVAALFSSVPADKKKKADQWRTSRFLGKCLFAETGCLLLLFAGAWLAQIWLMIAGLLAVVAVTGGAFLLVARDGRSAQKKAP